MKREALALSLVFVSGCGVDVAITAATAGTASSEPATVMTRKHAESREALARVQVERALQHFLIDHQRAPSSLDELVPDYMPTVPLRADGSPFEYDPHSGRLAGTQPSPKRVQLPPSSL